MDEQQKQESQAPQFTPCLREDTFKAAIKEIILIEHRFQDGEMEVKIEFITQEYETGKIYLDFSPKYIPSGKYSGRKSCEISAETLTALGHDFSKGFANIKNLVALNIVVYGKKNKDGYLNFYLSNGRAEAEINPADAMQKFNSLFAPAAPPAASGGPPLGAPVTQPTQPLNIFQQQPQQEAVSPNTPSPFLQGQK